MEFFKPQSRNQQPQKVDPDYETDLAANNQNLLNTKPELLENFEMADIPDSELPMQSLLEHSVDATESFGIGFFWSTLVSILKKWINK